MSHVHDGFRADEPVSVYMTGDVEDIFTSTFALLAFRKFHRRNIDNLILPDDWRLRIFNDRWWANNTYFIPDSLKPVVDIKAPHIDAKPYIATVIESDLALGITSGAYNLPLISYHRPVISSVLEAEQVSHPYTVIRANLSSEALRPSIFVSTQQARRDDYNSPCRGLPLLKEWNRFSLLTIQAGKFCITCTNLLGFPEEMLPDIICPLKTDDIWGVLYWLSTAAVVVANEGWLTLLSISLNIPTVILRPHGRYGRFSEPNIFYMDEPNGKQLTPERVLSQALEAAAIGPVGCRSLSEFYRDSGDEAFCRTS